MRSILIFVGIFLIMSVPADAAGCKVKTGFMGLDSVLSGTISGFEVGEGELKGDTAIYFDMPCDFFIVWEKPLPKACKKGRKIVAKGFYNTEVKFMFLADSISCH